MTYYDADLDFLFLENMAAAAKSFCTHHAIFYCDSNKYPRHKRSWLSFTLRYCERICVIYWLLSIECKYGDLLRTDAESIDVTRYIKQKRGLFHSKKDI